VFMLPTCYSTTAGSFSGTGFSAECKSRKFFIINQLANHLIIAGLFIEPA
jgi:hypothetical protein